MNKESERSVAGEAIQLTIKGLIQGVGFRPFIYRLACRYNLTGSVENTTGAVIVQAQGEQQHLDLFVDAIRKEAPPASYIQTITKESIPPPGFSQFYIRSSQDSEEDITDISPDIAVCRDCLGDMYDQPRRRRYPFINCTNCGPRFSIIKDLPYDRAKTTMAEFEMCEACKKEYENVADRRFHAQPISCYQCGPEYRLLTSDTFYTELGEIVQRLAKMVNEGAVIAVKGLGGFFMLCDATDDEAVQKLREVKNRDRKPFAVMFPDLSKAREYVSLTEREEEILQSWRRPVVLVPQKVPLARDVNPGTPTIGALLPYMPVHYLLFEYIQKPVVFTSGNISDSPIVIDNTIAESVLLPRCDALLTYNREIYNRVDDSVVMVVNQQKRPIRRSRGYVPTPVSLPFYTEGILATGAELANCFALGKQNKAILSQHIGDLQNIDTYEFFTRTIDRFTNLFRAKPELMVCDKHPDYLSSRYAHSKGLPVEEVQHHHAHIASCMAEHELDEQVIGVALDGTGFGEDGTIWGGEFLLADLASFERYTHFAPVPVPGGDKAINEPWRTGIAYLYTYLGKELFHLSLPIFKFLNEDRIQWTLAAMDKRINSPLSSSAGRLFDAVAAITGISAYTTYSAEAPMRLEAFIEEKETDGYGFQRDQGVISFGPTIREITEDLECGIQLPVIAAKFHLTVVNAIVDTLMEMREKYQTNKIVLSGGTFQNRFLLEQTENALAENDFRVYSHHNVPSNDGGIALGQLAVAAKRYRNQ